MPTQWQHNADTIPMATQCRQDDGMYTAEDKWDVFVKGPLGADLEVTVRPTQKARLLLKVLSKLNPQL